MDYKYKYSVIEINKEELISGDVLLLPFNNKVLAYKDTTWLHNHTYWRTTDERKIYLEDLYAKVTVVRTTTEAV
jgi:hypothetical protein